ncbi:MAG: SagB/ThcOx family dehydrogenase [Anaerolineae bacterium]|nr:SagB/ThcOx family dehydrogenase [Anaerolineae bacterium]
MSLTAQNEGIMRMQAGEGAPIMFRKVPLGVVEVLKHMQTELVREEQLTRSVIDNCGSGALIVFYQVLNQLAQQGMVCFTLMANGHHLACLQPSTHRFKYRSDSVDHAARYVLSRFAYCRLNAGQFVLESSIGQATITLLDSQAHQIIAELASPVSVTSIAATMPNIAPGEIGQFLNFLLNASAITPIVDCVDSDDNHTTEEDADAALSHWEFHDLLFHSRSRLGRHHHNYGGTLHMLGKIAPLAVKKNGLKGEIIPLAKPNLPQLIEDDMPFTAVLEQRRSVRKYAEKPITVEQLGHFLYRVAHVQQVFRDAEHGTDFMLRPTPNGGAIHELEIYPIVESCEGLAQGLYYYNPFEHQLHKLAEKTVFVAGLLQMAWHTANRESPIQVCLAVTARFQRTQWKYQSIAYALQLKHVGVLYQTMYLVATAMGLAPCALGGGDSDLFARAADLNYYAETTVGEFLLGSKKA